MCSCVNNYEVVAAVFKKRVEFRDQKIYSVKLKLSVSCQLEKKQALFLFGCLF